MIITNKLNLPDIFNNFTNNDVPQPHKYSVTELLGSVREIKLKRQHWNHIQVDVVDGINMLFGTAVHKIFEQHSDENTSEIKYQYQFGDDIVVGKADKVLGDTIADYKTATTSKKDFTDYEHQVYAYALLRFLTTGVITRKGELYVLYKDWSKIKAVSSKTYPQSPIYIHKFDIQDSDYEFIENYIKQKLIQLNSKFLPLCSDEERWYTGTKYAVYKKVGDKRASYVTDDEEDAHNYIHNQCGGAGEIEVRKGEYIKCQYYCNCNKFCDQYKEDNK